MIKHRKTFMLIGIILILVPIGIYASVNVMTKEATGNKSNTYAFYTGKLDPSNASEQATRPLISNLPSSSPCSTLTLIVNSTSTPNVISNPALNPVPALTSLQLVPYSGPVEHIFFHPLIAFPELAFDGDRMALDRFLI
ncbi:MAG: hypothetical protein H7X86_02200 [Gorillibacterium sp.]|nr:hypothetical protein [Gorillibacterium sp.]